MFGIDIKKIANKKLNEITDTQISDGVYVAGEALTKAGYKDEASKLNGFTPEMIRIVAKELINYFIK